MMSVRLKGSAWGTGGGRWCLHGGASPEMKRRVAALFWASGAASGQISEGKRRLRCSGFRSTRELGVLGAAAGSPRRRRGGGRAKLRRGRGEGRRHQRVGRWVQELVEAPREAETKLDLAGGVPARRAGGARHRWRESREVDWGRRKGIYLQFPKFLGT